MRTYCVLLHVFAALLLCECDYGMFVTPSPSTSEMPTDAISSISDSNTTVTTAKSITVGNGLSTLESGLGQNQSNDLSSTTESSTDLSESGRLNGSGSIIRVISSTARPESTTRDVKHHTTQKKTEPTSNIGAIIILIIILILIGILLGILYCLRKKGRSYSFDLTRVEVAANDYVDTPLRSNQQGISYEQTNKDLPACLDYLQEDKSEEKTNPIANGSIGEKTEQTPTNENDEQNVPEENSFSSNSSLATPGYMKKVEFNLDLDLLGGESDFNDSIDAEATDTAQNENNNNVSNAGRGTAEEIFTEISLDEPK